MSAVARDELLKIGRQSVHRDLGSLARREGFLQGADFTRSVDRTRVSPCRALSAAECDPPVGPRLRSQLVGPRSHEHRLDLIAQTSSTFAVYHSLPVSTPHPWDVRMRRQA